jgi:hypothetical protein
VHRPYDLDKLLSSVTVCGAYVYAIFSMLAAGGSGLVAEDNTKAVAIFAQHALLIVQVTLQGNNNMAVLTLIYSHYRLVSLTNMKFAELMPPEIKIGLMIQS